MKRVFANNFSALTFGPSPDSGFTLLGATPSNPPVVVDEWQQLPNDNFTTNQVEFDDDNTEVNGVFTVETGAVFFELSEGGLQKAVAPTEELKIDITSADLFYGIEYDDVNYSYTWIQNTEESYFTTTSNRVILFEVMKLNEGSDDELVVVKNRKPGDIYIRLGGSQLPTTEGKSIGMVLQITSLYNEITGEEGEKDWDWLRAH